MLQECVNCGHDGPAGVPGSDHIVDTEGKFGAAGVVYCEGDGFFGDDTPQCDCDLFEPFEDEDEDDDDDVLS